MTASASTTSSSATPRTTRCRSSYARSCTSATRSGWSSGPTGTSRSTRSSSATTSSARTACVRNSDRSMKHSRCGRDGCWRTSAAVRRLAGMRARRRPSYGARSTSLPSTLERGSMSCPITAWRCAQGGELLEAERILGEAIPEAARRETNGTRYGPRCNSRGCTLTLGRDGWPERARRTAERAMSVFEHDHGELAHAWILVGVVETLTGHEVTGVEAFLRAREHARAAGDDRREVEIWEELGGAMIASRTPVDEMIAFLDEETGVGDARRAFRSWRETQPLLGRICIRCSAGSKRAVSCLRARSRSSASSARSTTWPRPAGPARNSNGSQATGPRRNESCARRCGFTKRWGRSGIPRTSALSSRGSCSNRAARPRPLELLELAEQEGTGENIRFQLQWRTARAKVLATRGETVEAERLAREAVEIVGATDNINAHAEALVDLAEVLQISGQDSRGRRSARRSHSALRREGKPPLCGASARNVRVSWLKELELKHLDPGPRASLAAAIGT